MNRTAFLPCPTPQLMLKWHKGVVHMELIYSSADLNFLASCLEELEKRVQALLRKNGNPLQRQGLEHLLENVEHGKTALSASSESAGPFALEDLGVFYSAVYAQRRKINQFLDTSVCPADQRNDLVSAAATINSLLRKLRTQIEDTGVDADTFIKTYV